MKTILIQWRDTLYIITIIIIEIQKEVIIDEKGFVTRIGIAHDGLSDRRGR